MDLRSLLYQYLWSVHRMSILEPTPKYVWYANALSGNSVALRAADVVQFLCTQKSLVGGKASFDCRVLKFRIRRNSFTTSCAFLQAWLLLRVGYASFRSINSAPSFDTFSSSPDAFGKAFQITSSLVPYLFCTPRNHQQAIDCLIIDLSYFSGCANNSS